VEKKVHRTMPKNRETEANPEMSASTSGHAAAPVTASMPTALPAPADSGSTLGNKALTVAAVGVAAALIEVELIPGMLLGVAAMLMPNLLPRLGSGLRPLVKGAVRAGYGVADRARETIAEAGEQFQDIVAEVKSEQHATTGGSAPTPQTATI
jgi:Protein of unknown function (DUF5132)